MLGPTEDLARQLRCPAPQTDVVDTVAASHGRAGRFVDDPFGGSPLRLCVYDVSDGRFVTGQTLVPDERASSWRPWPPSPDTSQRCSRTSPQLAVVGPRGGGPSLYLELDGCRRVVSDAGSTPVVRASDDLVALLGG